MVESTAHLVDHALPEQPIRQWVLSFPHPPRFLLAAQPANLLMRIGSLTQTAVLQLIDYPCYFRVYTFIEARGTIMAETFVNPHAGDASRISPVFNSYLEASQEASRRKAQDIANGLIPRVEKSPYGGYVVRSWPVEILTDPDMRRIVSGFGATTYQDL